MGQGHYIGYEDILVNELRAQKAYIKNSQIMFYGEQGQMEKKLILKIINSLISKYKYSRLDDIIFGRRKSCECQECGGGIKKQKVETTKINLNELLYTMITREAVKLCMDKNCFTDLNFAQPDFLNRNKKGRNTKINMDFSKNDINVEETSPSKVDINYARKNLNRQNTRHSIMKNLMIDHKRTGERMSILFTEKLGMNLSEQNGIVTSPTKIPAKRGSLLRSGTISNHMVQKNTLSKTKVNDNSPNKDLFRIKSFGGIEPLENNFSENKNSGLNQNVDFGVTKPNVRSNFNRSHTQISPQKAGRLNEMANDKNQLQENKKEVEHDQGGFRCGYTKDPLMRDIPKTVNMIESNISEESSNSHTESSIDTNNDSPSNFSSNEKVKMVKGGSSKRIINNSNQKINISQFNNNSKPNENNLNNSNLPMSQKAHSKRLINKNRIDTQKSNNKQKNSVLLSKNTLDSSASKNKRKNEGEVKNDFLIRVLQNMASRWQNNQEESDEEPIEEKKSDPDHFEAVDNNPINNKTNNNKKYLKKSLNELPNDFSNPKNELKRFNVYKHDINRHASMFRIMTKSKCKSDENQNIHDSTPQSKIDDQLTPNGIHKNQVLGLEDDKKNDEGCKKKRNLIEKFQINGDTKPHPSVIIEETNQTESNFETFNKNLMHSDSMEVNDSNQENIRETFVCGSPYTGRKKQPIKTVIFNRIVEEQSEHPLTEIKKIHKTNSIDGNMVFENQKRLSLSQNDQPVGHVPHNKKLAILINQANQMPLSKKTYTGNPSNDNNGNEQSANSDKNLEQLLQKDSQNCISKKPENVGDVEKLQPLKLKNSNRKKTMSTLLMGKESNVSTQLKFNKLTGGMSNSLLQIAQGLTKPPVPRRKRHQNGVTPNYLSTLFFLLKNRFFFEIQNKRA